jgi:CheY-like chemotaxis protein
MNREPQRNELGKGCAASARQPGILIADDMALILTLLKFELESRGLSVWLAWDGDDAIDLYRRHRNEIDLVLLDVQMPGLDGPQTLAALQELDPNVVACFMSGNLGTYTEAELLQRGAACTFNKPFKAAEVAQVLAEMAVCESRTVELPTATPLVSPNGQETTIEGSLTPIHERDRHARVSLSQLW